LASCGFGSRRKCEELVTSGRVVVNGVKIDKLAVNVNDGDAVTVNGKVARPQNTHIYIIMNKPHSVITSCVDKQKRKTVMDVLREAGLRSGGARVFPIGRLDYDSTGLLLLTSDGEFAESITRPSSKLEKAYLCNLDIPFRPEDREKLENGIEIEGEMTLPARVRVLKPRVVELCIVQGRNRQVRKMFSACGYCVMSLKRTRIGKLELGDLREGEIRVLYEKPVVF